MESNIARGGALAQLQDLLAQLQELPAWLQIGLVALVAVQLILEIYALVVLLRTPDERLVLGKKWPWIAIILLVNMLGAIVFLAAGRKPLPAVDPLLAADLPSAPPLSGQRASRAADVLYGPQDGDAE
jgi:predicted Kef-type K+ transport protein